jgi:hypothetical protein
MKIGWSPYAAPAGPNAVTQGGSATSFSQLLAAGYSADAIRGQRALGFGETGLLGAPRKADRSPASGRSGVSDGSRRDVTTVQARPGQMVPALREASRTMSASPRAAATAAGNALSAGRPIFASSIKTMPVSVNAVTIAGSHQITAPNRNLLFAAYAVPFHRSKQQWPKRNIVLTGPDDGASLIIYLGSEDMAVDDQQISGFYCLCSQYGVTLDAVRLFEENRA